MYYLKVLLAKGKQDVMHTMSCAVGAKKLLHEQISMGTPRKPRDEIKTKKKKEEKSGGRWRHLQFAVTIIIGIRFPSFYAVLYNGCSVGHPQTMLFSLSHFDNGEVPA